MPADLSRESNSTRVLGKGKSFMNRLQSSRLISMSDLHSSTSTIFLMAFKGTHQALSESFSRKVAAGRITSQSMAVGVMNRSTQTVKSICLMALCHFLGSMPVQAIGLAVCIHMPLI